MDITMIIISVLLIWFFVNLFAPNLFSPERLCLKCGTKGKVKKQLAGTLGVEIALWIFFILPGVIYSIWRHSNKKYVCSSCGSSDQLIPLDSPKAKEYSTSKIS